MSIVVFRHKFAVLGYMPRACVLVCIYIWSIVTYEGWLIAGIVVTAVDFFLLTECVVPSVQKESGELLLDRRHTRHIYVLCLAYIVDAEFFLYEVRFCMWYAMNVVSVEIWMERHSTIT